MPNNDDKLFELDNLESWMDAEDDEQKSETEDDVLAQDRADAEFAQAIVDECQGTLENGNAKAAISLVFDMVNPLNDTHKSMARQAMYKPVVTINRRWEFIEVVLTFPTALDSNLRVLKAHFDKYGEMLEGLTMDSVEVPIFSFVIMPLTGLGTYYMTLDNPVMWSLSSDEVGKSANQIKFITRGDHVGFFQTDEADIAEIEGELMREEEETARTDDLMADREAQRQQYEAQLEEIRASMRYSREE